MFSPRNCLNCRSELDFPISSDIRRYLLKTHGMEEVRSSILLSSTENFSSAGVSLRRGDDAPGRGVQRAGPSSWAGRRGRIVAALR